MLNLSRLAMLRELQRTGTMTATAEALHYTHSAVSQQLAQLEKDTGHTLFEKRGRRVELTDQGRVLADYAQKLLALSEEAESQLDASASQVSGTLRVASFPTMVATIVPRVISALRETHPNLTLEISLVEAEVAVDKLFTREFDLVMDEDYEGYSKPLAAGLHRATLFRDPMKVVTPASGKWSKARSIEELADAAWVLDPEWLGPGRWARAQCRQAGFEPHVQFESIDALLFKHLVKEGHAVAFLPELLLVDRGGRQIDPDMRSLSLPGNPTRALYTTVLEGRQKHPAIAAFREAMVEGLESAIGDRNGKL